MLGIVGALEAEVCYLVSQLDDVTVTRSCGVDVHQGRLAGQPVLVAQSGVGKVNAALAAAAVATVGAHQTIFTGVAGGLGPDLNVGDIVIGVDLVQHDVDVTALGRRRGELLDEPFSWSSHAALVETLTAAAREVGGGTRRVVQGCIASGDQFVAERELACRLHQEFGAIAVEMEGAALAQACARMGIPFAVVRVLSDGADGGAASDFPTFLRQAADLGARIVERFVQLNHP